MIALILPITTQKGYENIERSLINIEPELNDNVSVLAIVNDKDLYVKCRNFLNENIEKSEVLVVYTERTYPIRESLNYLNNTIDYVFIWNENIIIPPQAITTLYKDYLELTTAGFISGRFTEYPTPYWLDDIYAKCPKLIYSDSRELQTIQEVDVASPFGVMTKANIFKDFYFKDHSIGDGLWFGWSLRKNGFRNYVDTRVNYKYGGKNENNNVEGSAC